MADASAIFFKQRDEQVAPGKKPSEQDGKFLEHDGEHRPRNSCAEGDDKDDSLRLAVNYLFRYIIAEDESDTPKEEPIESAAHREHCGPKDQPEYVHDNNSVSLTAENAGDKRTRCPVLSGREPMPVVSAVSEKA